VNTLGYRIKKGLVEVQVCLCAILRVNAVIFKRRALKSQPSQLPAQRQLFLVIFVGGRFPAAVIHSCDASTDGP